MNIVIRRVWRQDKLLNVDRLAGYIFTGESDAHTFEISGLNRRQEVLIEGEIAATFLNAQGVTVPLTGSVTDGIASVTLTENCYAVQGPFTLTIYAEGDEETVVIYCGTGLVKRGDSDTVSYPSAAIPSVVQLITDLQDLIDTIPQDYTALSDAVEELQEIADVATVSETTAYLGIS